MPSMGSLVDSTQPGKESVNLKMSVEITPTENTEKKAWKTEQNKTGHSRGVGQYQRF